MMNVKFKDINKIKINRKNYCLITQLDAEYVALIVNLSLHNLTDVNNYIKYVIMEQNTKIEVSGDNIESDQKINFMYIAWHWIKNTSIKYIKQTWEDYCSNKSIDEIKGDSITQFSTRLDIFLGSVSACYFIAVGKVKDLVGQYGIIKKNETYRTMLYDQDNKLVTSQCVDGNFIVFKYGATDDIMRRICEHGTVYGPQIKIVYMIEISSNFIFNAERDIGKYFMKNGCHMQVTGHNELVIVDMNNNDDVKDMENKFKRINRIYGNKSNFNTSICKQEYNKILNEMNQNHKGAFAMIMNEIKNTFDEQNKKIDTIVSILFNMIKQESCRMC